MTDRPCRPNPKDAPQRAARQVRLAALVDAYVDDALRPFLVAPDKSGYAPADLEGAVVFGRVRRTAVAVGDPIGPDGWVAFDRWRSAAQGRGITTSVYQATINAAGPLAERGYRVMPIGREAIVDLHSFSLAGSRRANLRHTITRAQRGGVTVEWHPDGLAGAPAMDDDVARLNAAWAERAGPPMGFTITRFEPGQLARGPVAVAFDANRRVLAFATFQRTGARSAVLDVIRRQPGSTPGALEACIAAAASALAAGGVATLSLGLAPLSGMDPRSALPEERALASLTGLIRNAYDVDGLAFFKGKFDPCWQTRYLAVSSRRDFPRVAATLVWLHLARPGEPRAGTATGIVTGLVRAAQAAARDARTRTGAEGRPNGSAPASGTTARERLAVTGLAGASVWAGAQLGARGGRVAAAALLSVGAGVVAISAAGSRRARASGLTPGASRRAAAVGDTADAGDSRGTSPAATRQLTVLIAARNEECVLPDLIRDLAAQDHRDDLGQPLFGVIVVDDRSTDQTLHRTLESARLAGIADLVSVRARRGRGLPGGKGAALAFVPAEDCADGIVVLDADARLEPDALRAAAAHLATGVPALTMRRQVRGAGASWLAQAQADEQAVDAAFEEARWRLAGIAEFRGNGIVIRRDVLLRAGGWRAVLTEDLDLSARIAMNDGLGVAWPVDARVSELPVLAPRQLWRQRVRWAEGAIRATLEWSMPLARSRDIRVAARTARLAGSARLLVPFVAAGALAGGVQSGRPVAALAVPAVYAASLAAIAWDAIPRVPGAGPVGASVRARRSAQAALFMLLWLAAVPRAAIRVALSRGPLLYEGTPHDAERGPGLTPRGTGLPATGPGRPG